MIPKIIHYCWFGKSTMPPLLLKCIESWKNVMPDYRIIRWDESNIPINDYNFMREAYKAKKFAFVSDQARFYVLKKYGGFFLDTDVEVLKSFDDLCYNKCFFAFGRHLQKNVFYVSPGLIMGAEPENTTINNIFECYCNLHFISNEKLQFQYSSPKIITKYLTENEGLILRDCCQSLNHGIYVYSTEYFDPVNPRTFQSGSKIEITCNTYSIHHGAASWVPLKDKLMRVISLISRTILGDKIVDKIRHNGNVSYKTH